MPSILKLHQPLNFEDFTLILPSVSVGNVPQLAVDVIISTYKLKYAGMIYHPAFIQMVGRNSDTRSDGIEASTACELYALETSQTKIAVLQIRSGILSSRSKQLFEDLSNTITLCKFKEIIILTTAFAYEIHDVKSNPYRYAGVFDPFQDEIKPFDDSLALSGSGYAKILLNIFSQNKRTALLLQYISEGDNTADALRMVDLLRRHVEGMKKLQNKYEIPISWQYVYGKSAPMIIY